MTYKALPFALLIVALGAVVGGTAYAQQPSYNMEDVTACSQDAMRICKDKLPDLDAIETCMKTNYDKLRPACKARFDHER